MNNLRNSVGEIVPGQVSFLKLDEGQDGQRLDNFLIRVLKGVPKSHINKIIRGGEVRINGKRCDGKDRLAVGDELRIPPIRMANAEEKADFAPQVFGEKREFPHPIIFEDDHLIAVNKPSGTAVHGGSGVSFGVIEQIRLARDPEDTIELVHRLDRDTSGVLLLAKTRKALVKMHAMMQEEPGTEKPEKHYLALVQGRVANDRQHIKAPLLKYVAANNERRVRVDDADGQASHTIFNVIKRYAEMTLLEAELKTGRTHQIRVHCQHLGHPIAGDDKYGDFVLNKALQKLSPGLKRMFLHAAKLSFAHPVSGEPLVLDAPLPPELDRFLKTL
jgi:23S rRNA pseudouridine955/2504/2580 synthase